MKEIPIRTRYDKNIAKYGYMVKWMQKKENASQFSMQILWFLMFEWRVQAIRNELVVKV